MKTLGLNYMDVAKYIIWFSHDHGDNISNLKLQKLMYYAQAWFIANRGKSLFEDDFQAWAYGPVLPELYRQMKKFSYHDIDVPLEIENVKKALGKDVVNFLNDLMSVFMPYQAYEMELMVHNEAPWIDARVDCGHADCCEKIITKEAMKKFYGGRINKK